MPETYTYNRNPLLTQAHLRILLVCLAIYLAKLWVWVPISLILFKILAINIECFMIPIFRGQWPVLPNS